MVEKPLLTFFIMPSALVIIYKSVDISKRYLNSFSISSFDSNSFFSECAKYELSNDNLILLIMLVMYLLTVELKLPAVK